MADRETTFRLKFENEDMERVFRSLIDRVEQTERSLSDLEKGQRSAFDSITQKAKGSNEELRRQAENLDTNKVKFKEFGRGAGDALQDVADQGGAVTSTLARLGRSAGPVGAAIAAALGVAAAAFLDVKRNAEAAKRELAGLKGIGNELKNRVFAGVRFVVKQLAGDVAGAGVEFERAFGKSAKAIGEARKEAQRIFDLQKALQGSTRALIRLEAQRAAEIERLRLLAADEQRTTAERIQLIRQATAEEIDLNGARIANLETRISLIKQENRQWQDTEEALDQIADLEAEITEIRGVNAVIGIRTQQEINSLLREEAQARRQILEDLRDFNALAEGEEGLRSLEKQIAVFRDLRESVTAAGLADQFSTELNNLDQVIAGLERRLSEGLVEPFEKLPTLAAGAIDGAEADFIEEGRKVAESLNTGIVEQLEELTPEQLRFLQDSFGDVFNSIADIAISSTQTAIQQQERLIQAREQAIGELESQIAEQERLEAQGLANNAAALRESLQQERQILQQEQEKRLELERRAANQRLLIDSIQQASQITLATAKLLSQGASGFIPGLIAAAGGVALLFRILAQAKANAANFSQVPKFREGTPELFGPSHEAGGILIEAEGGERILSRALNAELGGSRLTNEDLVQYARQGIEMSRHNAGEAIGPLRTALQSGSEARQRIQEAEDAALITEVRRLGGIYREEVEKVVRELRARPTYTPLDQLGVREYWKGKSKITERIRPDKK